jgi:hypothetical protein
MLAQLLSVPWHRFAEVIDLAQTSTIQLHSLLLEQRNVIGPATDGLVAVPEEEEDEEEEVQARYGKRSCQTLDLVCDRRTIKLLL